jgi:GNAT superfamily N-acetyltransferase
VIRRARTEESDAIAELFERSHSTQEFLPHVHTIDEHRAFFAQRIAEDHVWAWDEDGVILGYMILRGDDELRHLYVEPSETRRGIGTALLDHAKRELPRGFTLWTFQENDGARRFYERNGLRAIAFGDGSGNEEGVPDVQYEWRPTPPAPAA